MTIKKAVFPVAGFGTRFLPATKVVAKEMLPVVDTPLIHYAVREALAAGCTELIFVTNRYKHDIADFFDTSYELEKRLEDSGKTEILASIRNLIPPNVKVTFVTQKESKGLGHAILCAEHVVGKNEFVVLLPDDLIWSGSDLPPSTLSKLMSPEWELGQSIAHIATMKVTMEQAPSYGIIKFHPHGPVVVDIEEKPKNPSSDNAVIGRYLFSHKIFNYLHHTVPGAGGEIQLTDAILHAIRAGESVRAYTLDDTRFDCGSPLGMFEAQMYIGVSRLGSKAYDIIKNIVVDR